MDRRKQNAISTFEAIPECETDYPMIDDFSEYTTNNIGLRNALNKLIPLQRYIILKHYFSDLDFKAIAKLTNLSQSNICRQHKNALKTLCALMEVEG